MTTPGMTMTLELPHPLMRSWPVRPLNLPETAHLLCLHQGRQMEDPLALARLNISQLMIMMVRIMSAMYLYQNACFNKVVKQME